MRRVTIDDVARLAGVSRATVSRVLNGNGNVSEKTRQSVLETMKRLDYRPNALAQATAQRKSNTWGLVISYDEDVVFLNPFFSEVLRGVSRTANSFGYNLLLVNAGRGISYADLYRERRVDGIILVSPRIEDDQIASLLHYDIPFVSTSKISYSRYWVDVDNVNGGFMATQYLIERGHTRIGYVSGPKDMASSGDRLDGYRLALGKNGIPFDERYVISGNHRKEDGFRALDQLMSLKEPPTAVFAASDLMAIGIIQKAKSMNLHVPKDLSVIGFDDIPFASDIDPPLTTIRQPAYLKGLVAGGILRNLLAGRPVKPSTLLKVKVIERASVCSQG